MGRVSGWAGAQCLSADQSQFLIATLFSCCYTQIFLRIRQRDVILDPTARGVCALRYDRPLDYHLIRKRCIERERRN
jgi:hypothetical protein